MYAYELQSVFNARQHAERAICYRSSVCPTVCHTGRAVKTVEVRIMQLLPQSSPITIVFASKFNPEIMTGSPSGGVKQGWGGENKLFSNFMRRYLENGTNE